MDEIKPLLELVPQIGLWVIFLWLYLRESKERKDAQEKTLSEIKLQIAGLDERLARHIDRTEKSG
jgi:hypothetical protein